MAELSPDLAARIESLKASHAENPARFFMPLASAYREAGEIGRAEELLRENLKRHPGYLSAHVLLGRCLADRGAVAEARNEFQYVLSVDPQNLIALRTLGDMASAAGDGVEARRWYNELLAVDPMNADARQSLHLLDHAPARPAAPAPEPAAQDGFGVVNLDGAPDAQGGEPANFGAWGEVSLDAEPVSADEAADWESDAGPAPAAETPSGWGDLDLTASPPALSPDEPASEAAAGGGFDALDFGAVDFSASTEDEDQAADPDATVEMGSAEPAGAGASSSSSPFDAWGSLDDGQVDADAAAPRLEGLSGFFGDEAPHEHEEEEVVTETMAELYARQGFLDRAADVYRELIARRGAEPALVRRLDELEAQMSGQGAAPATSGAGTLGLESDDLDFSMAVESGPPDWLQAVDAASSAPSAPEPAAGLPDVGVEPDLPELELSTDLNAPPADVREETQALAESAPGIDAFAADGAFGRDDSWSAAPSEPSVAANTGDTFADSFSRGFDGASEMETAGDLSASTPDFAPPTDFASAETDFASSEADFASSETDFASAETDFASSEADFAAAPADFAGAEAEGAFEDDRAAWETPTVEETEPVPGLAEQLAGASAELPAAHAADAAPAEAAAPASGAPSIRAYLSNLLGWRPGAPPAAPAPLADFAPPAEEPASSFDAAPMADGFGFDAPAADLPATDLPAGEAPAIEDAPPAETPVEAPAAEEADPWAEAPAAVDEPSPWETPAAADEPAPWEAPAPPSARDDEPWGAPAASADDGDEVADELPWVSFDREPAETPAPEAPRGDELMPWDTPFDLAGEAHEAPVADRAEPRPEPTVEESSGFSFEDFFSGPPAPPAGPAPTPALEAAPALEPVFPPEPEPAPAPPQPQGQPGAQGGDDDEDLESFQAWLQSLKR